MTLKLNIDKAYSDTVDRRPAGNSGLAKVAVSFSADTFVVTESSVLRINICGKNRHLRQAAKRYAQFHYEDDNTPIILLVSTNIICGQKDCNQS
jgi:hypothetical protein